MGYLISPLITRLIDKDIDPQPVTPEDMGTWLNLPASAVTAHTALLEELIETALRAVEEYTWIDLRPTTYEANYELCADWLCGLANGSYRLKLERSPILTLDNITKIEYLNDSGTYTEFSRGTETVTGLFENVTEREEQRRWASIYFLEEIPFDSRANAYKVKVTFIAGYDNTETGYADKIPSPLITAVKKIVAFHYRNRGDCGSACDLNGYPVPCDAKGMLDLYSIAKTILGGEYNTIEYCGDYGN